MAVTARCDRTELLVDQCSCPDHRGAPTARRETVLVGLVGEPSDPTMVHRLDSPTTRIRSPMPAPEGRLLPDVVPCPLQQRTQWSTRLTSRYA